MPLAVIVSLIVAGFMVLVGVAGFLIDRSAERHERGQSAAAEEPEPTRVSVYR